jgi:hypothetical protein
LCLSVLFLVALSINIVRNIVDFMLALLNCCVKLHSVVGCVAECLLEVRDLPRKFTLGRFVLSVLLLNLWLVFQLDGLFLKHGSFHILNHFFLFLA